MKNTKKAMVASLIVLSLTAASVASAANDPRKNTSTSEASASRAENNREMKRLGAYLGILGDPHPTGIGLNVAYNVASFMRASVGFGKVTTGAAISMDGNGNIAADESSTTTIGFATKFMIPSWNLTPSASLGYSHISISDNTIVADYKSSNIYLGLGGDWQAESGFNLGAGLNLSLNGGAPTAPYINVGVFF